MDKDNQQSLITNPQIVRLQDVTEENTAIVRTTKTTIERRILLPLILLITILILLVTIAILILIVIHMTPKQTSTVVPIRKVLFVIADGIPADLLENATIPNMRNIGTYKRAYVGGDVGTYTETVTISAPGYMCLLTGTWGNKHHVDDNDVNNANYNYKNIFRLIKEQRAEKKIGIFSTWVANRVKLIGEGLVNAGNILFDYKFDGYELDLITYPHDSASLYIHHIDQRVAKEASRCIKTDAPDVSWVYLQYTDDIGHKYGDSEQMYQAIGYVDQQIGQIYDAIEYRQKYYHEDWLIVITTDHGRDPINGSDHGEQSERERTTWIVMNTQQTNRYFRDYQPAIVDILPTMMRFMNVTIPVESERELDGVPMIGQVSLAKPNLYLYNNTLTIRWKGLDGIGNVRVWLSTTNFFQNGSIDHYALIGSVPVQNQFSVFDVQAYPSEFYKIVLEGEYNMVNKWIIR